MIVLDLETVPAVPIDSALIEISGLADDGQPSRSLAECDRLAATYAALTPPLATIAVAGLYTHSEHKRAVVNMRAFGGEKFDAPDVMMMPGESGVVERVFQILGQTERWPLVTFNGRRFDFPVLMAAALRNGVKIPPPVFGLMTEYRYAKTPNHVDLWDILTNFGAGKGSLRAWCIGLGLGDPKENGDGSDVAKLVATGKVAEAAAYCLSDCDFTARLYARFLECKGK